MAAVLDLGLEFLGTCLLVHLSLVLLEAEPGLAIVMVTSYGSQSSWCILEHYWLPCPLAPLLAQDPGILLEGTVEGDGNVDNPPSSPLCTCVIGVLLTIEYIEHS